MTEKVSLICARDYDPQELDDVIETHFSRFDFEKKLHKNSRVLIKPNLLAARSPSNAVTTHPEIVAAILRYLKKREVHSITIADTPGGIVSEAVLKRLYTACGYDVFRQAAVLNLDLTSVTQNGFPILKAAAEADVIINCAKLKTHGLTVMTGAVKNLFGCIPGLKKPEYHCIHPGARSFCDMLIDLCETVKPTLSLIDAIDCMEGNGPGGGIKRHMGITLCSSSPYALDVIGGRLMNIPEKQLPLMSSLRSKKKYPDSIELLGDPLIPADPPFLLPDTVRGKEHFFSLNGLIHIFYGRKKAYPKLVEANCVGCGRCAESCPKHVIVIENKKARFSKDGCISCFCCQEMCPAHAIEVIYSRPGHSSRSETR